MMLNYHFLQGTTVVSEVHGKVSVTFMIHVNYFIFFEKAALALTLIYIKSVHVHYDLKITCRMR